jgi:FAD synthase
MQTPLQTISTVAASRIPAEGVYLVEVRGKKGRLIEVDMYIDGFYVGTRPTKAQAEQDAHATYYDMLAHSA